MNIISMSLMRISILPLLTLALLTLPAVAAQNAAELYSALEQRLQSLKSLEIQYQATTGDPQDESVSGRMIWIRPDRFYHDTPEWTLCQTGKEQWRLLKQQQTLIREDVTDPGELQPESVLFSLSGNLQPKLLTTDAAGSRELRLESKDPRVPGYAVLTFPAREDIPSELEFTQTDGDRVRYRITRWDENVKPAESIFSPPDVPAANVIDFRGAGLSR
jgi:outer membrane lipoprotein-sorting protein